MSRISHLPPQNLPVPPEERAELSISSKLTNGRFAGVPAETFENYLAAQEMSAARATVPSQKRATTRARNTAEAPADPKAASMQTALSLHPNAPNQKDSADEAEANNVAQEKSDSPNANQQPSQEASKAPQVDAHNLVQVTVGLLPQSAAGAAAAGGGDLPASKDAGGPATNLTGKLPPRANATSSAAANYISSPGISSAPASQVAQKLPNTAGKAAVQSKPASRATQTLPASPSKLASAAKPTLPAETPSSASSGKPALAVTQTLPVEPSTFGISNLLASQSAHIAPVSPTPPATSVEFASPAPLAAPIPFAFPAAFAMPAASVSLASQATLAVPAAPAVFRGSRVAVTVPNAVRSQKSDSFGQKSAEAAPEKTAAQPATTTEKSSVSDEAFARETQSPVKNSQNFSQEESPLATAGRDAGTAVAKEHAAMPNVQPETKTKSDSENPIVAAVNAATSAPRAVAPSSQAGNFSHDRQGNPEPSVQSVFSDPTATPAANTADNSRAFAAPAATGHAQQITNVISDVTDAVEKLRTNGRGNVEMQIKLNDGQQLTVKLQMHAGEVRTTFKTDSGELRDAITRNWSDFSSSSAERGVRVTTPVFESPGTQTGFGNFNQRQDPRQQAESMQGENPAMPARLKPSEGSAVQTQANLTTTLPAPIGAVASAQGLAAWA